MNENIDVTVPPKESSDRQGPQRDAFESADPLDRERQKRQKIMDDRAKGLDEAKRAFGEARRLRPRCKTGMRTG